MAEIWGMVVGAVVGAGATIYSSSQQSNAAKSAANAQTTADQNAIAEQQREFNLVQQLYAPQRNLGYGAMGLLSQLYGLPNPQANNYYAANAALPGMGGSSGSGGTGTGGIYGQGGGLSLVGGGAGGLLPGRGPGGVGAQTSAGAASANPYGSFYNQPGYQFTLGTGLNAINRQATANGSLYSTNNLNQLGTYAEGVASQQYNNYVQQLLAMAGLGGSATAGSANAATNTGNNISQLQVGQGNANASGIIGSAGGVTNAINQTGGYLQKVPWGQIFGGGGLDVGSTNSDGTQNTPDYLQV